jgi:hypothetical protein
MLLMLYDEDTEIAGIAKATTTIIQHLLNACLAFSIMQQPQVTHPLRMM